MYVALKIKTEQAVFYSQIKHTVVSSENNTAPGLMEEVQIDAGEQNQVGNLLDQIIAVYDKINGQKQN